MRTQKADFGGYVTKNDLKCSDGRIIRRDAFKDNDGGTVPLVWQHMHNAPDNILGHVLLENRDDGVYGYAFLNESANAKLAGKLVEHGDITAFSIYANSLVEREKSVMHGKIHEVSLVLSGANPGAKIDNIALQHADGSETELDDEAIIFNEENIDFAPEDDEDVIEEDEEGEEDGVSHSDIPDNGDSEETIADVFDSLDEKQKTAVYALIGQILEDNGIQHSDNSGESETMKKNVFDGSATQTPERHTVSHADMKGIIASGMKLGSMRAAVEEYALAHSITNIEYLFPEAQNVTGEPTWIARNMEWVAKVMDGVRHVPFSRLKSLHADITVETARARGYIKANEKVEEVFAALRRTTTPKTVYKKQSLDRDDIIDITDFSVVSWLKAEMRVMLNEELARAMLVSDGRDPVTEADDKIDEDKIRPIWGDSTVYVTYRTAPFESEPDALIDEVIAARTDYKGSGRPSLYAAPSLVTSWLLLRDQDGRRLYRGLAELAQEMNVAEIVEVPVMEDLQRTNAADDDVYLRAILVNLKDYTAGADRGGEVNSFEDFDIDFNKMKYLIETRMSGAMTVPQGAVIIEELVNAPV